MIFLIMNAWYFWIFFKAGISILALIICVVSLFVIWRVRGILQWQRSLHAEMKVLNQTAHKSHGSKRLAMLKVMQHCDDIRWSHSPDPAKIIHLDEYLHGIASCYYPDSKRPELCLTLGQTLSAATIMVERLNMIIKRKGLRRFAYIRIKHIHKALRWYQQIYQHSLFSWFLRHRSLIFRLMFIRRFFLIDPFSWVAYFSNRLTILIITRTLLLDIYLFIGLLAIDIYDPQTAEKDNKIDNDQLAETLATLYDSSFSDEWQNDPELTQIRSQLTAIPKKIIQPPTIDEWKQSITKAANIIAARHFNQSNAPMEEAALGPIVTQLQNLLQSITEVKSYTGIKQLFALRLESLYDIHAFSGNVSGWPITRLMQKVWGGYRTLRWPFKFYRWIKRSSPTGIAVEMGWEILRKTMINFLARFTFDKTCKEIDGLYYRSKKIEHRNKKDD
jgi:hypothetical protein